MDAKKVRLAPYARFLHVSHEAEACNYRPLARDLIKVCRGGPTFARETRGAFSLCCNLLSCCGRECSVLGVCSREWRWFFYRGERSWFSVGRERIYHWVTWFVVFFFSSGISGMRRCAVGSFFLVRDRCSFSNRFLFWENKSKFMLVMLVNIACWHLLTSKIIIRI